MKKNLIISGSVMVVVLAALSFVNGDLTKNNQVSQVINSTKQPKTFTSNIESKSKDFVEYINSLSQKGEISGIGTVRQSVKKPDIDTTEKSDSRSFSCDTAYILGGRDANSNFLDDVFSLDSNNNWSQLQSMDDPRSYFGSTFFNGSLWTFGGVVDGVLLGASGNDVWSFDGTTWTQHTDAPWQGRFSMGLVEYNGQIWVLGGYTATVPGPELNDVWSFDGTTWTQHPNAPWSERAFFDAVVYNGQIWVFGGLDINYQNPNDVWSFDGTTWTQHPNAPWSGRKDYSAVVYNNQIWLFGGEEVSGTDFNDVWSFDGTTWTQHPNAPWPARFAHQSFVHNSQIWLAGGFEHGSLWFNDVWSFDGTTWTQHPNAPWSERWHHASASDPCPRDISVQKYGALYPNNVAGYTIQVSNNGQSQEVYYLADVLPNNIDIYYVDSNDPNALYLTDNSNYPFNLAFFTGTIPAGQTFDFHVFTVPIVGQSGLTFNNISIVSTTNSPDDNPGNDVSFWPVTIP